jgi:hypothetical protein
MKKPTERKLSKLIGVLVTSVITIILLALVAMFFYDLGFANGVNRILLWIQQHAVDPSGLQNTPL